MEQKFELDNLFDVPVNVLLPILTRWLFIQDVCKLDSALVSTSSAPQFVKRQTLLGFLSDQRITFSSLGKIMRLDVYVYQRWIGLRSVTVERDLCIRTGYKHLCKRVPSLCDVVGSVDVTTSRANKTEQATGGVFNYTPDSIESILLAMKLPDRGLRFLDAGCGDTIFATLIQMSFPDAEVVGIDLPPIVTTLKSIQKYCSYKPFKDMKLYAIDIEKPEFAQYVDTFKPTHAACIVGLEGTEVAFLSAMQAASSVQCIAVAEKRNPARDTPFEAFGFVQTHRVAVQLAGSRKKRHVLVAVRKPSTLHIIPVDDPIV